MTPQRHVTTEAALRAINSTQAQEIIQANADNRKLEKENEILAKEVESLKKRRRSQAGLIVVLLTVAVAQLIFNLIGALSS